MTSMLLHALQTIIFVLATVAQAESIPHRERLTPSGQVAMEVEADGSDAMEVEADGMDDMEMEADDQDDQYAEAQSQPAMSRIIRSWDSVRKQPTDVESVELGESVLPAGSPCIKKKGTCHSTCAKTVSGHTYKREWCYTTPERKANSKKWCFCTAGKGDTGSSDDEMPEQVVGSKTRGSAIPVEKVASGEQPPEPPQDPSGGQNEDLVKQVKAMSAKLEGLQSVVDDRLGKVDDRLKKVGADAAAGRKDAKDAKDALEKKEDLDDMNTTNETNSTNSSNETDTDGKGRKGSGFAVALVLLLCFILPICGVLMASPDQKAPTPPPAAVPPEQSSPGDEQAQTEQAADPAAPTSQETSETQGQSVAAS